VLTLEGTVLVLLSGLAPVRGWMSPIRHARDGVGAGTEVQRRAFKITMDTHPTTLERAFQLARSGGCKTIEELKRALRTEGHSTTHIIGRSLTKQLRELMKRPPDTSA
jgi:phosphoribosylformimino-5-aminoimidazole carboxamide ribonucleotide (ProFAR) isomerase